MKKIDAVNPVKFLKDEAGRSDGWIMNCTGCSARSVVNWYNGEKIARYYRPILMRLMAREETRLAANIIEGAKK